MRTRQRQRTRKRSKKGGALYNFSPNGNSDRQQYSENQNVTSPWYNKYNPVRWLTKKYRAYQERKAQTRAKKAMYVNDENLSSSSSKKKQTQHQPHVNADENLTFLQRLTRRLRNPFGSKQKAATPKKVHQEETIHPVSTTQFSQPIEAELAGETKVHSLEVKKGSSPRTSQNAFTDEQARILPDALPEQPSAAPTTYNFDLIKAEDLAQGHEQQHEKLRQIKARNYLDELERTTQISILPYRKIMYETAIDNILKKTSIKAIKKFKKLMKSLISDIYLLQRLTNGEKVNNFRPEKKTYFEITDNNYYLLLPSLTSFAELFPNHQFYDGEGGLTLNKELMEKLISETPDYLNGCLGLNSRSNDFLSEKRKTHTGG